MDVNSENSKAKSFQEGCHFDQKKFVFKKISLDSNTNQLF